MRHKSEEKLKEIKNFIWDYMQDHAYAPSFREIADYIGMSLGSVHAYISELQDRGVLTVDGRRKIELNLPMPRVKMIPILGSIVCGEAEDAEEYIEDYMALPASITGDGEYYLLRTHGDSMIDAGIEEGDLVLIRKQTTAREGQIVVAEYDNKTTLKRIHYDDAHRRIHLQPENEKLKDIVVRSCRVQGVATKLIKDL